jgi:spermidine/putrescine transport system substrate-binding protein
MRDSDFSSEEFTDKLMSGKLSRRQFTQMLSAAGVTLAMVPATSGTALAAAQDQATYFTWGGYDIPELFDPYIREHGTAPNFASFGGSEEALTKLRAGYVVDVVHPCNAGIPRWMATGLFQGLDTGKLSHWDDLVTSLWDLDGAVVNGMPHFAPFCWGQTSITYRTDLVDWQGQPESWSLLWDERYKGRLASIAAAGDTWWCAAIYGGVDFNKLSDEANVKIVSDLLRQQRPLMRLYSDDMTTLEQALASGELVAAMTWNSSPVALKKQGVPVAFANPKEGALTWVCGAMLHKDSPNPDRAHDIVNSLISPETGSYIIDEFGYGHSNLQAFADITDDRLAELGLSRDPNVVLDAGKFQVPQTQEFESYMNNEFEQIKAGF